MNISINISNILIEIRKKTGLSQIEFCKKLDISQSHLSHIEKGTKNPTLELVVKLIEDFDVPVTEIFKGTATHSSRSGNEEVAPIKEFIAQLKAQMYQIQETLQQLELQSIPKT